MAENRFELGKFYKHTTGEKLYICGVVDTNAYGKTLVGEDEYGNLIPIEFYYPQWIENIPIRFIRKIVKNWYWKHGEWLEWQIEKWRDNHGRG